MERHDGEALRRFAREHHVHYEVEPDMVEDGGRHRVAGYEIRVFAGHEGAKLEAPGCERCVELTSVYQSIEERDADEVRLTVRVRCNPAGDGRAVAADERCVGELRERLAAAGVPRS
jgi:hypothetical protein